MMCDNCLTQERVIAETAPSDLEILTDSSLSLSARCCYLYLRALGLDSGGAVIATTQEIAKGLDVSRRTVVGSIGELKRAGMLRSEDRGRASGRIQANAYSCIPAGHGSVPSEGGAL